MGRNSNPKNDACRPFIPWVGGKEKLAPIIRQVFPPKPKVYLEPFGGSGAILLGMNSSLSRLDIYNDFNADLVNLFLCVKEKMNVLSRELKFLPFHSRAEFEMYKDFITYKEIYFRNIEEELEVLDDPECFTPEQAEELRPIFLERAELFDARRAAAYFKNSHGSFNATTTSFGVKACNITRFIHLLQAASPRLREVAIENKDGAAIIRERDSPDSLIYCDPPYYRAEKLYTEVFSKAAHRRLYHALRKCKGYVVVSYNDHPYIRNLYKDFYIMAFKRNNPMSQTAGAEYGELLITNYDPRPYLTPQFSLFSPTRDIERELKLIHIPQYELRTRNLLAA